MKQGTRIGITALWLVAGWAGAPLPAEELAADGSQEEGAEAGTGLVEYVTVQDSSLPSSNTIATKLSIPLQLTPAHVGTVGEALLYEQDADVLGDALRNVSSLNIQNGSGVHEYFTIRGFDSVSSGLVMTDGAQEPAVSVYQMYNVRGVEVLKGPGGFLYGKNPLAGAVNIVRKQPLSGNFAVFHGTAGSFGTREGTIDWNQASEADRVGFRLNALWQESDHYRDDKESEHLAVNPGLTLSLAGGGKLNFNFEYVDAQYQPDNGLPLVDGEIPSVSRRRSYQSAGDFSEQTLNRFQIDFEQPLGERFTLRNKSYYRGVDWVTDGTLLSGTVGLGPDRVGVFRNLGSLDDRQQFTGNQLELIVDLQSGPVKHELLAGLEIVRETDRYRFDVLPLIDIELFSMEEISLMPDPELNSRGDVTNQIVAPYAVDRMIFSERFELVLGLRYDHIDVEGEVMPLGSPAVNRFSRDDSELSPMAGFVFAPGSSLSFYANAAESYAPPSTRLVDEFDPASREPERGRQVELGVKKQFMGGKVRTTAAAYQLERDRIAIADATGFAQQSGDQRSRGFELEIAAEPRPRLRTFFSYAYTDAELTEFVRTEVGETEPTDYSGKTPIMAPEHLANLWVSKSFRNGLGISGGARFIDEQYIYENNAYVLDQALLLDAALFFDTEAWRFKLNLNNLTGEEYETRGIAGATSVIPADPFAAYLTVEFRIR